jgi:hypothetical protein
LNADLFTSNGEDALVSTAEMNLLATITLMSIAAW